MTKSSVAATWSNWSTMRLPAVRELNVAEGRQPDDDPNTVSIMRAGRASIPASASSNRSRTVIPTATR